MGLRATLFLSFSLFPSFPLSLFRSFSLSLFLSFSLSLFLSFSLSLFLSFSRFLLLTLLCVFSYLPSFCPFSLLFPPLLTCQQKNWKTRQEKAETDTETW